VFFPIITWFILRQSYQTKPHSNDDGEGGLGVDWENMPLDLPPLVTLPIDGSGAPTEETELEEASLMA
jgi:hypothetical protein